MSAETKRTLVQVVDYDPEWPTQFGQLRDTVWPTVCDIALGVEHVGSTAVPGLAAKPIIDLDIVIPSRGELPLIVTRLGSLGYEYLGNLDIQDREAFRKPGSLPAHNLYVCPRDSVALGNHLALRDHLRAHPSDAAVYASLKKQLAARFPYDIDRYIEGKTEFILRILARYGFGPDRLDAIRSENQS